MIEASASEIIAAPRETIFKFMNRPENQAAITPSLIDSREIGRMPNGGARAEYTYKMAGMKMQGEVEATEFVPNDRIVFRMTGALTGTIRQTFEAAGDGATRVTYATEYEMPGPAIARLAEPLLARYNQREIAALLSNLKDRMEMQAD